MSINQLLDRLADLSLTTDSSKVALGGYWNNGLGFRLIVEGTPLADLDINVLELLAIVIGILELMDKYKTKGRSLQVFGDNTASIGWLKSAVRENRMS